jgi:hypothetical protein
VARARATPCCFRTPFRRSRSSERRVEALSGSGTLDVLGGSGATVSSAADRCSGQVARTALAPLLPVLALTRPLDIVRAAARSNDWAMCASRENRMDASRFKRTSPATIALAATGLEPATRRARRPYQTETTQADPLPTERGRPCAFSDNGVGA